MIVSFNDFINNLVVEELHPELHSIVTAPNSYVSKQTQIAKKIKDLTSRGETTGIEGNMPKGSSRAYLKHAEHAKINLDGKDTTIPVGTKVAIKSSLDKHHNHNDYDGMSLGALQNHAEGGDHWVNSTYRTLTNHEGNQFTSNKEGGIFPPLLDHDHVSHQWSHVGHVDDLKKGDFQNLTKTKEHPNGITHKDFTEALNRFHERNNGKYWKGSEGKEARLDHVDTHPLVQRFQDYHGNTGNPTYDYQQKKNMGVWTHPDGSKHIVSRDHGFDTDTANAYQKARRNKHTPSVLRGL